MPSPIDLCLASEVAADLNVAESAVSRSITAASAMIARYLGYPLEQSTTIEHPVSGGSTVLFLDRAPIIAVTEVKVYGTAISASDYSVNTTLGTLKRSCRWPLTATIGGYISLTIESYEADPNVLEVTYSAGYVTPGQNALDSATFASVTLPPDIQEAAIQVACGLYKSKGQDPALASESLGDWSVSYRNSDASSALSDSIKAILAPYRRVL